MDLPPDPYKALGVSSDAQPPEIRSAYRELVVKCHPDQFTKPNEKAAKYEEFRAIQNAYEILTDNVKKREYNNQVTLAKAVAFLGLNNKGKGENTQQTTRQTAKRGKLSGILVARGRIRGTDAYAIPDTGAECNIITTSFAGKLGLRVQRHKEGEQLHLRTANGRYIATHGIVHADWLFSTDMTRRWLVDFYVLEDFMCDLLLGNDFLMKTKTMSHHKYRLSRIPRSTNALSVLRVNLLGLPSQRVAGTIGNWDVWALPDSGSEPNILSWKFVMKVGLESLIDWSDQRVLRFADGSHGRTEGSIQTEWTFRSKSHLSGSGVAVKFHVTRDCVYDAIVGQDMLEETDAFLSHEEDFVYVESNTRAAAMNLVIFAAKKASKSSLPPRVNDGIHAELQRRARVDAESRRMANSVNQLTMNAMEIPRGIVAGHSNDNRISHASDRESRSDTSSSISLRRVIQPMDVGGSTASGHRPLNSSNLVPPGRNQIAQTTPPPNFVDAEIRSEYGLNMRIRENH